MLTFWARAVTRMYVLLIHDSSFQYAYNVIRHCHGLTGSGLYAEVIEASCPLSKSTAR